MTKKTLIIILLVAAALIVFVVYSRNSGCPLKFSGNGAVASLISQAKAFEQKGDLVSAKNAYQRLVVDFPNSSDVMNWQRKIEELNLKLIFSPTVTAGSVLYEIKAGDTLTKISKQFKTTTELIIKSNNLNSDVIVPGRKIKVRNAAFNILVDKSQNLLMLKSGDEIIKTYIVSTGKDNSTPVGTYKITNKLVNPTWFKAGTVVASGSPENVLGTRWMGFDLAGYGIHGTTEPQNLGKQVTQGCVRLANSDVEELYTIVPVGTEVTIIN